MTKPNPTAPTLATLKEKVAAKISPMRDKVKNTLKQYKERKLSEVTVAQAYGGMRGVKCMVTETSAVDPYEGIRFRGYSIPELQEKLPSAPGGRANARTVLSPACNSAESMDHSASSSAMRSCSSGPWPSKEACVPAPPPSMVTKVRYSV